MDKRRRDSKKDKTERELIVAIINNQLLTVYERVCLWLRWTFDNRNKSWLQFCLHSLPLSLHMQKQRINWWLLCSKRRTINTFESDLLHLIAPQVSFYYTVYCPRPPSSAPLLVRKCNDVARVMVMTCVRRHARTHMLRGPTLQKLENLIWADENRTEQFFVAHIVQRFHIARHCWAWVSPHSGVTMLYNIVENIEQYAWAAKRCSILFSSAQNRFAAYFTLPILRLVPKFGDVSVVLTLFCKTVVQH